MKTVYTIGHSTHSIEDFVALLRQHTIDTLLDIRSFPGSRRCPQFGMEALERSLSEAGIGYSWDRALGGRRYLARSIAESDPRIAGWRVDGFKAFAHYALGDPDGTFTRGLERLEDSASDYRLAYMCSEHTHLKCHRRIVSDYLAVRGWRVLHIESNGKLTEHLLTAGAIPSPDMTVFYPKLAATEATTKVS